MNFVKPMLRTLLIGAFVVSLLTAPLRGYAEPVPNRGGGGDLVVFDRVDAVMVKPTTTAAPVPDDVIVDGPIITAEDGAASPTAPASPSAFNGRLLTAADLRADQ